MIKTCLLRKTFLTLPKLLMPVKRKRLKESLVLNKRCRSNSVTTPFVNITSPVNMEGVEILPAPVKGQNDKKNYRVIKLPNGLTALLISDTSYPLDKLDEEEKEILEHEIEEEEDSSEGEDDGDEDDDESDIDEEDIDSSMESTGLKMSAAGLCVHMGSFSDPEDIPGFAHFLEHMVFMGSPRFPDENSFDSFVNKHGGYDNASTDTETTVFYFETPRRHFHEGLDRFAQFFIEPLMKKDSMERERKAVESEFEMALPSDDNRLYQLLGSLASKGHPMAKFMWGNQSSLSPSGMTDSQVHDRLHQFRQRHYAAQYMCLTVQSQEELDTLQEWVVHTFGNVPNNGLERESFDHLDKPFNTAEFTLLYKLIPVKNEYKLDMTWALGPLLDKYRVKPLHYMSWVIGHEGKGSLVSFLRRKVWALGLTAGNAGDGFEFNTTFSMFPVSITLTKEGYEKVDQVVQAVFSYIDMMVETGPVERIYKEIQKIEDLDFAFREEKQPSENVESLCENMQFYSPERYLDGDDLLFEYNPKVISDCISALTREGVNICLRSKEIQPDQLDQIEPWFGTPFSRHPIPAEWTDREKCSEMRNEFHLPCPNIFIAEDTALCCPDNQHFKYPVRLVEDNQGELFYKHDNLFNQPRAYIHYFLRSPLPINSVENGVVLDLLVMCVMQYMTEEVYPAELAQLSYSLYSAESGGLVIKVSGLSDKLVDLLEVILDRLVSFSQTGVSEEMFSAVVEQLRKNYHNHSIKPKNLVRDVRLSLLQDVYHAPHVKHNIVRQFDQDKVKKFSVDFLGSLYIQGLVQGNLTKEQAKQVDLMLRTKLQSSPLTEDVVTELRCNQLPEGKNVIKVSGIDTTNVNSMVTNLYQSVPGDLRLHAVLETLNKMVEEPVFDTLRTKEQLGYYVSSCFRNTLGVLGLSVTVNTQVTKFSTDHVDQRIENFFEEFIKEHLNEEVVSDATNALIKLKTRADVTLDDEVSRNWNEVVSKEYLFDRYDKEVEILSSVRLEDVRPCLEDLLSKRMLSVQVEGSSSPETAQSALSETQLTYHSGSGMVEDPNDWKKSLFTYPIHYIVK